MSATVANFLVTRPSEWSVKRVFGHPGDGIMGALARDKFKFLQVRQGVDHAMVRLTEKRGQSGRSST
jgi:thiamine pyrophosphate-dependent acetolactate synthase large subunit-like protein